MTVRAATDEEVRREVIRRVREGEQRKAVAIELGLGEPLVQKFTAHLGGKGPKRDARTKEIVTALEAGEGPHDVATRTKASLRLVMTVAHALARDT